MEDKIKKYIETFKNATQHHDIGAESLKKQDIIFIRTLSHIIERQFDIKNEHSKFIAEKALLIAGALDMNAEDKTNLLYASMLLQIGKMDLPGGLIKKPFYSMSVVDKYRFWGHAIDGERLLSGLEQFDGVALLIRHQFERFDGQGFPDGLAKDNIPLGVRILSVLSDYIAYIDGSMTGKPMFPDVVLSQMMIRKASFYDEDIVDIFSNVLKGATVEELKEAIIKSKLLAIATERWKKGLVVNTRKNNHWTSTIVEISLAQLKLGMKVDNIYFGCEPYIRNCIVDQSIIDNVFSLRKAKGTNPVIKIVLNNVA